MRQLRILIISGWKVFPTLSGGHLRSGCVAQAMARLGHQVRLYSLGGRQDDYQSAAAFLERPIEAGLIEEVHLGWTIGLLQTLGRRLGWPRVWQYLLLQNAWIPNRLQAALLEADVIISDLPYCPPIPGPWAQKPWYLLSHNLEHVLLQQGTWLERRLAPWMARVEAKAAQRYHAIFACAQQDRDFFSAAAGPAQVLLLANGVDPQLYQESAEQRAAIRKSLGLEDADHLIVFSGSRFEPNLEALAVLREFCRREAVFLAQHRLYFLILGSMLAEPMREGALIATGRVPATAPYFAAADAALNPITRGSGSNVKLFEYLAAQLPILSTSFGVRGSGLVADRDFILYEEGELRAKLSELVSRKESWKDNAGEVWERHQSQCDILEIVRRTLQALPDFQENER